jgi:hypothetical protein
VHRNTGELGQRQPAATKGVIGSGGVPLMNLINGIELPSFIANNLNRHRALNGRSTRPSQLWLHYADRGTIENECRTRARVGVAVKTRDARRQVDRPAAISTSADSVNAPVVPALLDNEAVPMRFFLISFDSQNPISLLS